MALLEGYLDELGTDSLTKHQMGEAWQRLGATIEVSSSTNYFMLTIKGFDQNLEPSLRLLRHWLTSLKPDADAAKELASEYKMSYKQQDRTNSSVMPMVLSMILRGNQSEYLMQPTPQEVKKMKAEELLQLFTDECQYHCDVLYCGTQSSQAIAGLCRQYLSFLTPHLAPVDTEIRYQQYDEPVVYVYDMPDSRQTYVGAYGSVKPSLTDKEDALLALWSQYMGGSMYSVLFQEIREYRSMAYSTGGYSFTPNRARHNDYPSGYIAYLGTQTDKSMQALNVLDSVLQQMPVNEQNVASARQEILNEINNGYPSFRQLSHFISSYRASSYREDPKARRARIVPTLQADDMVAFYQQEIQAKPRIWFIIGNKKQLDMQALAKYGKVVELKRQDVMR